MLGPPPEPRYQGKPLSQWLLERSRSGGRVLARHELQSLGPDGVKWLAYQASRARIWSSEELFPDAPPWARAELWLRNKITKGRPTRSDYLHFVSIVALGELGPDAAPAIPALIKALRDGDNDERLHAAAALARIGPASWPAVADAIRHGTPRQRDILFWNLDHWFEFESPTSAEPYVKVIELLVGTIYEPGEEGDIRCRHHLAACGKALRNSPHFHAGLRALIDLLPRLAERERHVLCDLIGTFEEDAAAAIPALTELASAPDLLTQVRALGALAVIDPQEPRWPARLQEIRRTATGKLEEAAEWALIHAGR